MVARRRLGGGGGRGAGNGGRRAPAGGGRRRLNLAATKPAAEAGYSGLPAWGGVASAEIDRVSAWKLPNRWNTIAEMDGDPDCLAVFRAISLPILAAPLMVEPASDRPDDRQRAEFVERDLNNMTVSIAKHRAQTLRSPRWGNRIFETVFTRGTDGLYHLRKLALRPSSTISDWHLDDRGGPDGVTQTLPGGRTVRLDMGRLLVFVFGESDLGLIGEPLTRAMYGPWMLKTHLAKIGAAAAERHGMGIPTLRYSGTSEEARNRYESMLMGIHAHQKAFALLAEGVDSMADFEIKGVTGSILDPLAQMEYHRRACYAAGMAQHMLLGSESTGSFALSSDQSTNFLLAEQALAADLDDTYNRYLLPRWVGYNWPGVAADDMPRVKHGTLARRDVKAWFESLTMAVAAGVDLDKVAVSELARDLLGIVQADDDSVDDIQGVQDVNAPDGAEAPDGVEAPDGEDMARRLWALGRGPGWQMAPGRLDLEAERPSVRILAERGIVVPFVQLAERMDRRAAELDQALEPLQRKQAKRVSQALAKIIKNGGPSDIADWLADPRNIPSTEEAAAIENSLRGAYEDGYIDVWDELSQQHIQGVMPSEDDMSEAALMLAALAALGGRELASRMAGRSAYAALGQMAGRFDGRALMESVIGPAAKGVSDAANRWTGLATAAGRTGALAAAEGAGLTSGYIWSTRLDKKVCQYGNGDCALLEATMYERLDMAPPIPNPGCLGGPRCRCILVPFGKDGERLPIPKGEKAPYIRPVIRREFGWPDGLSGRGMPNNDGG